jgi:subtilisin family serine protease
LKGTWFLGFSLFFLAVTASAIFTYPCGYLVVASVSSYPNDPLLGEQWGWLKINADAAWLAGHEGERVVVAIFDTGIDSGHSDLKDVEIVYAWNYVDSNSNVTDVDGHGTLVAGVIAATTNNGIGIAGIAPKIQLAIFKVLEERGGSWRDLTRAVREARGIGADVYVMSLGGTLGVRATILLERELNRAYAEGAVIVAAAGNTDSDSPQYPAAYEAVIGVGAIDKNNTRTSWSSYGINVELMAPGVSILSTFLNNKYAYASGTSLSTPHVAGVVALLLGKEPNLTPDEVRERLRTTAIKLGDPYYYGYGIVDAQNALSVDITEQPEPPPHVDVEEPPLIEDEEPIVMPPELQPPFILDIIASPDTTMVGEQVKFTPLVEAPDG